MRYSDDIIREVISRNDIVEIIGEQVRLKRAGSSYVGLCPFHNEKTPSFSVSQSRQMYYCFGCHAGGNVVTFMMTYHNYTFLEALKYLADRAGITLPEEELTAAQKEASEHRAKLLAAYKDAAGFYYHRLRSEAGRQGMAYLRGRGLTDETIRHFGLGYSDKFGDSLYRYLKSREFTDQVLNDTGLFRFDEKQGVSDRFWNRVMFPIFDDRGRVIGFGGRVLGEGKPKYLNSPESALFNKRKNLYALNYARSTRERNFILCEGYMDVISMHQAGFTNAVASLGTALTPEQCTLLRRFTKEALLLYDSDGAGVNASLRAIPILRDAGIDSRVVSLNPYKDPDEFIRAEGADRLRERLLGSDDAVLFEIAQMSSSYRRSEPGEWTEFQHAAASRLAAIDDELERMNYIEAVSGRFGIPGDALRRLVSKKAAEGTPAEHFRAPASGRAERQGKPDSILTSEKLMLTYLAKYPEAYLQTKDMIGPSDFTDDLCRRIAEELYAQIREGNVSEAGLIASFPDAEEESRAAAVFHTELIVKSGAELDRAFTDTVLRILGSSAEASLSAAGGGDLEALSRYMEKKKLMEKLASGRPLHLTYDGEQ